MLLKKMNTILTLEWHNDRFSDSQFYCSYISKELKSIIAPLSVAVCVYILQSIELKSKQVTKQIFTPFNQRPLKHHRFKTLQKP